MQMGSTRRLPYPAHPLTATSQIPCNRQHLRKGSFLIAPTSWDAFHDQTNSGNVTGCFFCDQTNSRKHHRFPRTSKVIFPSGPCCNWIVLQEMCNKVLVIYAVYFENNTQLNEPSNITYHSSAGYDSSSAIIGACVFAFIVLSMGSFIAFVYKKHKGNFCWWLRSARRRNAAAISLSKCMQQYISNPNYYSTSLDTPLLGMRQLQIPPDSVVLLEEIGEGYFGKVHKGMQLFLYHFNTCTYLIDPGVS
ncbi:uncharacterized protein CDAR_566391 [Caerostris darwini]|uniref:Uncharacterized protein n=1 Tax=Caerostris darwini TaxID=1538125 RepID=A0AAV4WWP1_9ARAC|nr:uncharacterized protein CDAR_566391 [Caerostris darwini]